MYKADYVHFSKRLESLSVGEGSNIPPLNFTLKACRHLSESAMPEPHKDYKRFTTKYIRKLLMKSSWALLEEVATALVTITISTGVSTYVVNDQSKKLHLWIKGSMSRNCFEIKPGTILAAYSAYTKKLQVGESLAYDPNYPFGFGKSSPNSDLQALSLPVVTPNDRVLAVIELYRDYKGEKYKEEDQLIGLTITNWLAAAYDKHFSSQALNKENNLHQSMFTILTDFFKVNKDIDKLIQSIAMFIKSAMEIGSIKFYRNIPNKEHWAYVYEEVEPNKLTRTQEPKKINRSTDLVSNVLKKHKNLNINQKDENTSHYLNLLQNDKINAVLLVPIIRSGSVLGIIELINKLNGNVFTSQDEEFLGNFSKYYSLALHYTNVSSKQKKIEVQLQDEKKLLFFMLQPCEHDYDALINTWNARKDLPDNFLTFTYYPWQVGELKLMELSLAMLNYSVRDVFESEDSMVRFVMMTNKMYRKNYYHNFEHAFNVTHFMMNIKHVCEKVFSPNQWKALIIAAFCHDIDHPGFTNSFLKATSHYMVELYQDSVLENHHSYVAHLLIKQLNLFSNFSPQDYKFILNEIHVAIIDTDLAVYFKSSSTLASIITTQSFSWDKPEHTSLLKGIIMTTCDLSGQFKTKEVAVGLTKLLCDEFYLQGDQEKAHNLKPVSLMDRELIHKRPTDQLDFIMLMCVPCADILVTCLPQLKPILANVIDLINYWLGVKSEQSRSTGKGEEAEKENEKETIHLKRLHERINDRFNIE